MGTDARRPRAASTARALLVCLSMTATAQGQAAGKAAGQAAGPAEGTVSGTLTIDATTTAMTHAVRVSRQNAFDETATDPVVVLSNRALTAEEAADEAALLARAARGELVAMAIRFDGRRGKRQLFNVSISSRGQGDVVRLPDVWFAYTFKGGAGTLKMVSREFAGRTYATAVEFSVPMPAETTAEAASPAAPALPPPSRTDADRQKATALLIDALREGDEQRALAIVALGVDPNGRDEKMGIPVIGWAVLMCQPLVVKALVELEANITFERIPGMTLLDEATAACPEAVLFLRGVP
ncbi:MAG: hypothetical protein ACT4QD_08865 [Acidobacteriota bacterium]